MTKLELYHRAVKIAKRAHKGQKDKYGAPYIQHVLRVVENCVTLDQKIVAALHDVVEDNPEFNIEVLRENEFPEELLFAVECLTKTEADVDYMEFIKKTERSPIAVQVKIRDLIDNMDLKRAPRELTKKDLNRFNKYHNAYLYLIEKY